MFSKAYVHYVFQNTVKCSLIVNHIKMAHSNTCGCHKSQVSKVGLAALFLDRHLKGHELQSLTISHPYHAYGSLRECIQMRCSICIAQAAVPVFVSSALSSVLC